METWCFLYAGKGGIFFPINMKLSFRQKSKDDLFLQNTPKDDISGITLFLFYKQLQK